ncbi:MAG: 2-amino-4-hydroxy-6-hydroxymethyldihydropteridine diphosphokinase [Mariprofundaceae bacterium]
MLTKHAAYIALGGNLGDVLTSFISARLAISNHQACQLLESSDYYQTPPIGQAGQADYLNAVLLIHTQLTEIELLELLHDIENSHGRVRKEHWGARTLDLDIISYDKKVISSKRLILPHALMHQRQFVLKPLCDIDPNWLHPQQLQTAQQLLNKILASNEPALQRGISW